MSALYPDPATFMANLIFFSHDESNWVLQYKKNNLPKARKSVKTFLFIDDLCAIHHYLEFEKNFKETYLPELTLTK